MSTIMRTGYGMMPNEVLYDDELSSSAKLFFVCISSHIAQTGYAFATNGYFATKMNVNERQIQRWLTELDAYLFIYKERNQRRISFYPGDTDAWGVTKKTWGGDKKDTHNNITSINNKNKQKAAAPLDLSFGASEATGKKAADRAALLGEIIGIVNPKEKVTQDRLRVLNGRLKDYTPGEIIEAAKLFSQSVWHKNNGFMSVDKLLAPSKFGQWHAKAQESPAKNNFTGEDENGDSWYKGTKVTRENQDEITRLQMED